MRDFMKFRILLLTMLIATAVSARPMVGVNVGGSVLLPMGNFKPGFGGGAFGTAMVGSNTGLAITASSGYQYYSKKDSISSFSQIPIMGGVRLKFGESPVYASGELGAILLESGNNSGASLSSNTTNLAWDVGMGSEFGPLDLRLSVNGMSVKNAANPVSFGINLSFRLWDNL